jgi:hypothetical protein
MPYKDHLEKLLEGKHFRHELVIFNLDEDSGAIHRDHRSKLLPILMRILYGKFHSHETTHTSSRDTKSNKRMIILQFLSSCNEYEMNYFFNLLFDCLNTAIGDDSMNQNNEIDDNNYDRAATFVANFDYFNNSLLEIKKGEDRFEINENNLNNEQRELILINMQNKLNEMYDKSKSLIFLSKCIPLRKLLGVLNSLEIIMKKLARQMETFAHRLLQIICFIHKYAQALIDISSTDDKNNGKSSIQSHQLSLIKNIKQQIGLRFKQVGNI